MHELGPPAAVPGGGNHLQHEPPWRLPGQLGGRELLCLTDLGSAWTGRCSSRCARACCAGSYTPVTLTPATHATLPSLSRGARPKRPVARTGHRCRVDDQTTRATAARGADRRLSLGRSCWPDRRIRDPFCHPTAPRGTVHIHLCGTRAGWEGVGHGARYMCYARSPMGMGPYYFYRPLSPSPGYQSCRCRDRIGSSHSTSSAGRPSRPWSS
jgi:hypothetical protein